MKAGTSPTELPVCPSLGYRIRARISFAWAPPHASAPPPKASYTTSLRGGISTQNWPGEAGHRSAHTTQFNPIERQKADQAGWTARGRRSRGAWGAPSLPWSLPAAGADSGGREGLCRRWLGPQGSPGHSRQPPCSSSIGIQLPPSAPSELVDTNADLQRGTAPHSKSEWAGGAGDFMSVRTVPSSCGPLLTSARLSLPPSTSTRTLKSAPRIPGEPFQPPPAYFPACVLRGKMAQKFNLWVCFPRLAPDPMGAGAWWWSCVLCTLEYPGPDTRFI